MTRDLSIHLVTDSALCGERGVVDTVREAVAGGVSVVQLRDKSASDASVIEQLIALSDVIDGRAALVVDDRIDAALEARRRERESTERMSDNRTCRSPRLGVCSDPTR